MGICCVIIRKIEAAGRHTISHNCTIIISLIIPFNKSRIQIRLALINNREIINIVQADCMGESCRISGVICCDDGRHNLAKAAVFVIFKIEKGLIGDLQFIANNGKSTARISVISGTRIKRICNAVICIKCV